MNHTDLLPDDPRLTAFALGELEGDDRAAVEAALRHDPALRHAVEEIRATAAHIEAALAAEVAEEEAEVPENVVEFPGAAKRVAASDPYAQNRRPGLLLFPQVYFVVGGIAAACFALVAVLRTPPPAKPAAPLAGTQPATPEKTLVDMSALMRATEESATASVADKASPTVNPPRTEEAVTIVTPPPATPRTLLGQTKASEQVGAGETPLNLQFAAPTPGAGTGSPPMATLSTGATIARAAEAPKDGQAKLQFASGAGEGRVRMHLPDEKFVVEARPANPVTTVTTTPGPNVPGVALSGRDGMIYNETRGRPGSSVRDVTGITNFDTVAPREAAPADAPVAAVAPVQSVVGETMFLSPFTVSADRFRNRVATAAAVAEKKAEPVTVLAQAKTFAPPPVEEAPGTLAVARFGRTAYNSESYAAVRDNEFISAAQHPFSTFSIDTDTASYTNVRRFAQSRQRPPRDAVRIEELLNYFTYHYAPPAAKSDAPFATSLEVTEAPWAPAHRLVRIGLKAREVATAERPAANLVFLIDVSGSMNTANRLPLVKESMRMLLAKLRADDRVAIVTYAGQSGLALPSTPVAQAREIVESLESLSTGGSTNGAMGIQLAYDIAKANRVEGGINRVILCTDGDFNVGMTSESELVRLIAEKAKSGVFLTVLGFGMGNLKDRTLEKLADTGNGTYGYIDSRKEAEKLLVQQVNGTLVTIAKDVKIQVEFNPSQVSSYRLIGYENRMLKKDEFKDDKVDAGEIGAGHTVTALYEVIPVSVAANGAKKDAEIEERRYNYYSGVTDNATVPGRLDPFGKEMLTVKVRYKKPDQLLSRRVDFPLTDGGGKFSNASPDFKFAAAVAGFGMILRESPHKGTTTMANVIEWAEAGAAEDAGGYRSEFIELARQADALEK